MAEEMVGSIIDSMDMSLSKLWEIVKDRDAWHAAIQGRKPCLEHSTLNIFKMTFGHCFPKCSKDDLETCTQANCFKFIIVQKKIGKIQKNPMIQKFHFKIDLCVLF